MVVRSTPSLSASSDTTVSGSAWPAGFVKRMHS